MGMQFWMQVVPVVAFLILGLLAGTWVERRHFRRLATREAQLSHMLVTDTRQLPSGCAPEPCTMVFGEVVIASDYFKTFAAQLRKLVGGELRMFETLMERARREALLRMMEHARELGASRVVNVRFATSNIGSLQRNRRAAMVEMYAYGTAIYVAADASS